MTLKTNKKNKNLLLVTSSAGGGHIQAAQSKAIQSLSEDPNINIIQKDLLIDWVGYYLGKLFVSIWNVSQKKGNLKILTFLSKNIPFADLLFWVRIFLKMISTLIREDIDQIIDTQPLGTCAMIKAIKIVRRIKGKPLTLEKVITELPTQQVLHFFKPIKGLSQKDRNFLSLISTTPLLKPKQTSNAFWMENCGLKEKEVRYEDFPLRTAFETYRHQLHTPIKQMKIAIQFKSDMEKILITETIKRSHFNIKNEQNKLVIMIEPQDKVSTILLGSHPAEEATIQYIKSFIEITLQVGDRGFRHLLFVFCDQQAYHRKSLLHRVYDAIQKFEKYPAHLTIIPMCFQGDDVIAPLYYRSNATFTRSGGLTSMELMSVAQGQIWIHSEIKGAQNQTQLSKGMPIWEQGNAYYLKEKKGANFITPETFPDSCHAYFMSLHT